MKLGKKKEIVPQVKAEMPKSFKEKYGGEDMEKEIIEAIDQDDEEVEEEEESLDEKEARLKKEIAMLKAKKEEWEMVEIPAVVVFRNKKDGRVLKTNEDLLEALNNGN